MKISVLLTQKIDNSISIDVLKDSTNSLLTEIPMVQFNRDANGEFYAQSDGLFLEGKTSVNFPNNGNGNSQVNSVKTSDSDENKIYFSTKEVFFDSENTESILKPKDGLLFKSLFEIEVIEDAIPLTVQQQSAVFQAKADLAVLGLTFDNVKPL